MGCFQSHLAALRQIVAGAGATAIVFEDDAQIDAAAVTQIHQILHTLTKDRRRWACVNLVYTCPLRRRRLARIDNNTLFRAYQFPLLSGGLLWRQDGVRAFLEWCLDTGIYAPFDNQLRDWIAAEHGGVSCARARGAA